MTKFEEKQWIVRRDGAYIGRVKDVYEDEPYKLIDIVLYNRDGSRLGRESPAMGGPRDFEPACPQELWEPIKPPAFPLPRYGNLIDFVKRAS